MQVWNGVDIQGGPRSTEVIIINNVIILPYNDPINLLENSFRIFPLGVVVPISISLAFSPDSIMQFTFVGVHYSSCTNESVLPV